MDKAVLISIRPMWCKLIASGHKTIELRKTKPKLYTPFKCYIYCTKPSFEYEDFIPFDDGRFIFGGGKVIGEFVCDRITDINLTDEGYDFDVPKMTGLKYEEMEAYLGRKNGYGWHISELKIYDYPLALSNFIRPCCERVSDCGGCQKFDIVNFSCKRMNTVTRPPQSWMYVETKEE